MPGFVLIARNSERSIMHTDSEVVKQHDVLGNDGLFKKNTDGAYDDSGLSNDFPLEIYAYSSHIHYHLLIPILHLKIEFFKILQHLLLFYC